MAAVLALLSSLMWGTADYLGGRLSRRWGALLVLGVVQAVGLTVMVVVASVTSSWSAHSGYLAPGLAAGLTGCAGLACYYQSLSIGRMGVVAPIASLGVIVPVSVGIAGGDHLRPIHVLGVIAAIVGVVLASGPELGGEVGRTSVLLAGAAALLLGTAQVGIAAGSESSVVMTMTTMRAAELAMLSLVGVALLARRRHCAASRPAPVVGSPAGAAPSALHREPSLPRPTAEQVLAFLAAGVFDVGANLLFGAASTMGLLTLVAVFGSLYPVATILLARIFDAERLRPIQQVGIALALAGAVAISIA